MSKEIGPRERQLREMRERKFAHHSAPPSKVFGFKPSAKTLKALGAKIEATKPKSKPKKGKRK